MADDPEMLAFFENQSLLEMQDYLARGRSLEALDDGELTLRWVELVGIWAVRNFAGNEHVAFDDLVVEMKLRGREPPFDLVIVEMEAVRIRSQSYIDNLSPSERRQLESNFTVALGTFRQTSKKQPAN
jgi:hypothetical protein